MGTCHEMVELKLLLPLLWSGLVLSCLALRGNPTLPLSLYLTYLPYLALPYLTLLLLLLLLHLAGL